MPDNDALKIQIKEALKARYFSMIQAPATITEAEQQEKNRLSRSLAAFAIQKLANVAPAQAVFAVVDGYDDNGIDAIHFDHVQNRLFVVQSKIGDAPDQGENRKFCGGIKDLIEGRYERFNADFARVQPEVEDALDTAGLVVVGFQAHLGTSLGPHAISDLDALKVELNQFSTRFEWKDSGAAAVHLWLTAEHFVAPVNIDMTLRSWHGVDAPRRSFYGLVSAAELAVLYKDHGTGLFEKNIRHFLGSQPVNDAIIATLIDKPSELFYLNNGLTAICTSIVPKPGATQAQGIFALKALSIVNGAQTVGAIDKSATTSGAVSNEAYVLITLIEIGEADGALGQSITQARNTQNAVSGIDFAALDPNQERLRRELILSGITYLYRPTGEVYPDDANVITIQQAALALASLKGRTDLAVIAKREQGQLYDRNGPNYALLFSDSLSGVALARQVAVFKYLAGILRGSELAEAPRSRRMMFYRHAVFFILHIVARRHRGIIDKSEVLLTVEDQAFLSRNTLEISEKIYARAEALFDHTDGYLAIFRNLNSAQILSRDVMVQLATPSLTANALPTSPTSAQSAPASPATEGHNE